MGKHNTDYSGCGVYALLNEKTHRIYIGESRNIKSRFSSHRINFQKKSSVNEMYQEPIENFRFLVLYRCGKAEYEKFHILMELSYMTYFCKLGYSLYNKSPHSPEDNLRINVFSSFDTFKNVSAVFHSEYGLNPYVYRIKRAV